MTLAGTKGRTVVSKLVCWLTGSKSSHFVILFDDKEIWESDFLNVRLTGYKTFLKTHDILWRAECPMELEEEDDFWQSLEEEEGHWYDYLGFLYFGWRGLLRKLFSIPFPPTNAWSQQSDYLCVKMIVKVPSKFVDVSKIDVSITPPDDLIPYIKVPVKWVSNV